MIARRDILGAICLLAVSCGGAVSGGETISADPRTGRPADAQQQAPRDAEPGPTPSPADQAPRDAEPRPATTPDEQACAPLVQLSNLRVEAEPTPRLFAGGEADGHLFEIEMTTAPGRAPEDPLEVLVHTWIDGRLNSTGTSPMVITDPTHPLLAGGVTPLNEQAAVFWAVAPRNLTAALTSDGELFATSIVVSTADWSLSTAVVPTTRLVGPPVDPRTNTVSGSIPVRDIPSESHRRACGLAQ